MVSGFEVTESGREVPDLGGEPFGELVSAARGEVGAITKIGIGETGPVFGRPISEFFPARDGIPEGQLIPRLLGGRQLAGVVGAVAAKDDEGARLELLRES